MGLACVEGMGVSGGVWARRGHKSRVSRRLFASSEPKEADRNLQFAREHIDAMAASDAATWGFDFTTMTPLAKGPYAWETTNAAPQPYQTSHASDSAPDTHTHIPAATHTHFTTAATTHESRTHIPTSAANITTPNDLSLASHTTCLTLNKNTTTSNPSSPKSLSRPSSPLTTTAKPVKRLQQKSSTTKTPRKITDYFTEVRTPRLLDRGKMQLKTDLLDSTISNLAIRGADLRQEDSEN